jgi:SOS-response transcriptional repressor LexA
MILLCVADQASMHEMCAATGLKSTSTVQYRLENLERRGLVKAPPVRKRARGRTLTDDAITVLRARGHQVSKRNPGLASRLFGRS